jgi:protoporphyrinogen/coproporphyrinogen III oxidase
LNLEPQLVTIPKTSPLAKKRYLYIPDQDTGNGGLTSLPSSLLETFVSPIGRTLAWSVIREAFRPVNLPGSSPAPVSEDYTDESIHDFFTRQFGPDIALTMGSALTHGIYASDSRQVSVRAAFPRLWDIATRGRGSVVRGMILNSLGLSSLPKRGSGTDYQVSDEVRRLMKGTSVFTFRDGIKSLSSALEKHLRQTDNVAIHLGHEIQSIQLNRHKENISVSVRSSFSTNAYTELLMTII